MSAMRREVGRREKSRPGSAARRRRDSFCDGGRTAGRAKRRGKRTAAAGFLAGCGLLWAALGSGGAGAVAGEKPPKDFPRFRVPGLAGEMETLRELYWLHYPKAGPKATLWDEWLPEPSLWPAVETGGLSDRFRRQWRETLSSRVIDAEGYVATHQHPSIAHQLGWPFPFWTQGEGGWGWHFSFKNTVGPPWRPKRLSSRAGWTLEGAADRGLGEDGWTIELVAPRAALTTPAKRIDAFQAPFLQLRWRAEGLEGAQPCVEWATPERPEFGPDRRMYFDPAGGGPIHYTMIPMYRHPAWRGEISRLRLRWGNSRPGAKVVVQAFFTQYDTRHNINGPCFLDGCATYFRWTGDLSFLRRNINRMRTALRYVMTEHQALKRKVVYTGWVGHDGRSGLVRRPDGSKEIRSGHGVGNNYWDLLPFGSLDCYATIHYYHAVRTMAALERAARRHPEWQVPGGVSALDPDRLEAHARAVKAEGNRLFWNSKTGRFAACIDADGKAHDYGFTFLNLEAVYYDFATPEHARSILSWINGDRLVPGDTSQGADIYHWRFAPRATTRRNVDWYIWAWRAPESIPWGGQVQDGGAVLGFSYHDVMARIRGLGPDNAWNRLRETLSWFREVQAAGGYRKYYDGSREGSLQGCGTPGGLGLDCEFFESALAPQPILRGFLGFSPAADGFRLDPRLPRDWPSLTVDRIRWRNLVMSIRAAPDAIDIRAEGGLEEPCFVRLPEGSWRAVRLDGQGRPVAPLKLRRRVEDGAWRVAGEEIRAIRWERKAASD